MLQLVAVMAFGFLYFGTASFWSHVEGRDRRVRYAVHACACAILIFLVALSAHLSFSFEHGILIRAAEGSAPSALVPRTLLDLVVIAVTLTLLFLLFFWHPGTAVRVLIVLAVLWTVSQLTVLKQPLEALLRGLSG